MSRMLVEAGKPSGVTRRNSLTKLVAWLEQCAVSIQQLHNQPVIEITDRCQEYTESLDVCLVSIPGRNVVERHGIPVSNISRWSRTFAFISIRYRGDTFPARKPLAKARPFCWSCYWLWSFLAFGPFLFSFVLTGYSHGPPTSKPSKARPQLTVPVPKSRAKLMDIKLSWFDISSA